jgi:hypothetical protein
VVAPPVQVTESRAGRKIKFLAGIIKFPGSSMAMSSTSIAAINATDATPLLESPSCSVSLD